MGNVYRITDPDGSVRYTDVPSGEGRIERLQPDGRPAEEIRPYDHAEVRALIAEVQKRVAKLDDYFQYLEYLCRSRGAPHMEYVLSQLKKEDPQTWLKLQKYPQFQPISKTLGLKAGETHLSAAMGMATGKFTGSVEKWLESTVKAMMKRDRWGPYADVLGSKATTMAPPKVPTYSNSRLGQYLKVEDARAARAATNAAAELEASRAAVRGARSMAFTRMANPLLDLGLSALNPETATSALNFTLDFKLKRAYERGALDEEQYTQAHNLMSQGRYRELQDYLAGLGGPSR